MAVFTDEHVPSVFVTTLRSSGYDVLEANEVFGEGASDRELLEYCGEHGHVLVTNDRKDFAGELSRAVSHAGIVVYTDADYLRTDPAGAVQTLDRIFSQYPPSELSNDLVWLDQWRR